MSDPKATPSAAPADAARIEFVHVTDPLCCWSHVMEREWDALVEEFGDEVSVRLRMGGMIADWASFADPLNSVQRPEHMAPHWYYVAGETGLPIDPEIWREDPPHSSMPACLAVRTAGLQGEAWAHDYLRRARRAVMVERRNIARPEELEAIAEAMGDDGFDVARFLEDLSGEAARDALREDLREVRYLEVGRFPSTLARRADGQGPTLLMVGFRPHEVLRKAVEKLRDPEAVAGAQPA